ncbi:hypothetical protein, partial [Vibrio cholerae]|uniref:hypothetical protein n=1 Tax=Vibrio cholerae TaxID=666 RepID=UPI001F34D00C
MNTAERRAVVDRMPNPCDAGDRSDRPGRERRLKTADREAINRHGSEPSNLSASRHSSDYDCGNKFIKLLTPWAQYRLRQRHPRWL